MQRRRRRSSVENLFTSLLELSEQRSDTKLSKCHHRAIIFTSAASSSECHYSVATVSLQCGGAAVVSPAQPLKLARSPSQLLICVKSAPRPGLSTAVGSYQIFTHKLRGGGWHRWPPPLLWTAVRAVPIRAQTLTPAIGSNKKKRSLHSHSDSGIISMLGNRFFWQKCHQTVGAAVQGTKLPSSRKFPFVQQSCTALLGCPVAGSSKPCCRHTCAAGQDQQLSCTAKPDWLPLLFSADHRCFCARGNASTPIIGD